MQRVRALAAVVATVGAVVVPVGFKAFGVETTAHGRATAARSVQAAVVPTVVFDTIATTDADNGLLTVTGHVSPELPNYTNVYLQRYDPDAKLWVVVAKRQMVAGKVAITATRPGSVVSYRLVTPPVGEYAEGASAAKLFAHYVWRGAFTKSHNWGANIGGWSGALNSDSSIDITSIDGPYSGGIPRPHGDVMPTIGGCLDVRARVSNRESLPNANSKISLSGGPSGGGPFTQRIAYLAGGTSPNSVPLEMPLSSAAGTYNFLDLNIETQAPAERSGWTLEMHLRCAN